MVKVAKEDGGTAVLRDFKPSAPGKATNVKNNRAASTSAELFGHIHSSGHGACKALFSDWNDVSSEVFAGKIP